MPPERNTLLGIGVAFTAVSPEEENKKMSKKNLIATSSLIKADLEWVHYKMREFVFIFASLLHRDQLLKESICFPRSSLFPSGVDLIWKGYFFHRRKQLAKLIPFVKMAENHLGLPIQNVDLFEK
ncbi:MAG: hypothetical protein AB2693_21245 [Candidatus Thiodiazotropha sp.]